MNRSLPLRQFLSLWLANTRIRIWKIPNLSVYNRKQVPDFPNRFDQLINNYWQRDDGKRATKKIPSSAGFNDRQLRAASTKHYSGIGNILNNNTNNQKHVACFLHCVCAAYSLPWPAELATAVFSTKRYIRQVSKNDIDWTGLSWRRQTCPDRNWNSVPAGECSCSFCFWGLLCNQRQFRVRALYNLST